MSSSRGSTRRSARSYWSSSSRRPLGDLEKPGAVSLATSLRLLRERLRERLPELLNELTSGLVVIVDAVVALDPRSFWIGGWCVDADGSLGDLEAISPEGQRIKLLEGAYRYHRADVEESLSSVGIRTGEKHGFAKYVELPLPSPLNLGWLSRLEKPRTGSGFELPMPAVTRDPDAAYGRILGELSTERTDSDELRRDHARPSLLALQRQMVASVAVARETQHGTPPEDPAVSIVVPLYERIDLIEHQLAHFWRDPDFHAAELIYVLDSPNLSESLGRLAGPLHELYGIPFKVLELNQNSGYSTANNVGFAHSRGRLLLLLNWTMSCRSTTAGCRARDRAVVEALPDGVEGVATGYAVRRGAGPGPQRLRQALQGVHALLQGLAQRTAGTTRCPPRATSSGCRPTATSGSRRCSTRRCARHPTGCRHPARTPRGGAAAAFLDGDVDDYDDAAQRPRRRPDVAALALPEARRRPPAPAARRDRRRSAAPARPPSRPSWPGATSTPTCCYHHPRLGVARPQPRAPA